MNGHAPAVHTITALKRWSCVEKALPPVRDIDAIHVYDFDNTLFASPLPNKEIWTPATIGQLQTQDFLYKGGWWHNPSILAATGRGAELEEPRAWEGYWNEKLVELVELSMSEENALCVLITGRMEKPFSDLITQMITAKGLDFDMVCLKPSVSPTGELFSSTMAFKQALLRDIVYAYTAAEEIRIYEDRPKHTKGFRDFFADFNKTLLSPSIASPVDRAPITAVVIQVSEEEINMEPVSEVATVQRMINNHNLALVSGSAPPMSIPYKIKRSVYYTGYIVSPDDIDRLKSLVRLPPNCPEHEVRHLAHSILITPRPAPPSILTQVGGVGAKLRWRVVGLSNLENRLWAARVQPIPPDARIYTENATPCVVLAIRRQVKPIEARRIVNWQPVSEEQAYEFETTVGEKVLLRVEEEFANEDPYEASFPNPRNARKRAREEDFPPLGSGPKDPKPQGGGGHYTENRQPYGGSSANNAGGGGGGGIGSASHRGSRGYGGRAGGRGVGGGGKGGRGYGGGSGRGGGRGGRGGYKSLDDNVGQGYTEGMQY